MLKKQCNNAPIEPGAAVNPLHVPVIISGQQLMLIEFIQTVYLIKYVFNESKNTKCFDAMIGKAIINKFMYVCIFAINIRLGQLNFRVGSMYRAHVSLSFFMVSIINAKSHSQFHFVLIIISLIWNSVKMNACECQLGQIRAVSADMVVFSASPVLLLWENSLVSTHF